MFKAAGITKRVNIVKQKKWLYNQYSHISGVFYVDFIELLASKKKPKTASPEFLSAASVIEL